MTQQPHSFAYTQFSSVQSLSRVWLFATPWIAARQASLSVTNSRSWPKLTSIESVMPSSHLILCRPLLLLPPIPPNIRVFSSESTLCTRWPKYWSFRFSTIPSKEHPGPISFRMDWYPEKTIIRKDACTPMFVAALFTIAKTWKPSRCPSREEWIKKMWYVYTTEYYSAIKKNETMSFAAT